MTGEGPTSLVLGGGRDGGCDVLIGELLVLLKKSPSNCSVCSGPTPALRYMRDPSAPVHVPGTPQMPASALRNEGAAVNVWG